MGQAFGFVMDQDPNRSDAPGQELGRVGGSARLGSRGWVGSCGKGAAQSRIVSERAAALLTQQRGGVGRDGRGDDGRSVNNRS